MSVVMNGASLLQNTTVERVAFFTAYNLAVHDGVNHVHTDRARLNCFAHTAYTIHYASTAKQCVCINSSSWDSSRPIAYIHAMTMKHQYNVQNKSTHLQSAYLVGDSSVCIMLVAAAAAAILVLANYRAPAAAGAAAAAPAVGPAVVPASGGACPPEKSSIVTGMIKSLVIVQINCVRCKELVSHDSADQQ
eukprot:13896-Heterococcus_DN1.PRE.2